FAAEARESHLNAVLSGSVRHVEFPMPAFFIVLDNKEPDFDSSVNGAFLSRDADRLERIAKSLGIRQLEEYVSYAPDEASAMMEDLGADPEGVELPEEQWFDAQEGLDLVAKLTDYIHANPKSVKN